MEDQVEQIISEVTQIREQYFAEVGAGARRAWPKSIRERILALDELKISRKEISRRTGVPYETIMQWRYYQNRKDRGFHGLTLRGSRSATVTVAAQAGEEVASYATVTVTSPSGFGVKGSVSSVVEVLKRLGWA